MTHGRNRLKLQDQLILAGIEELNQNGIQRFSLRRVANMCGVSCAAPYKHYKDKQSFIAAILTYIDEKWEARQTAVAKEFAAATTRKKLLNVCMEYIRFLVENPHLRSIIMFKLDVNDEEFSILRGKLSKPTYDLVSQYCTEVNMTADVRRRKTFVVRSLIYGAALMFDNGELAYTPENLEFVAYSIDREFDLD